MKHDKLVQSNKNVDELICSKLLLDGIIDESNVVCMVHMKLCTMKILSEQTNLQKKWHSSWHMIPTSQKVSCQQKER
jgi:hypothetical protein